ncbi:MAG: hypothetical protein LBB51_00945 [Zoogloeaceae bacterium]|jgi:hypothetical protein|nr:hypothetical protein [Zoogloeaceae bacterium]
MKKSKIPEKNPRAMEIKSPPIYRRMESCTSNSFYLESLSKYALHALANAMSLGDVKSRELCIDFFLNESRGIGDGRIRALIARRLKHCPLTSKQICTVIDCILERFLEGRFSEGFKDQLQLVRKLNPALLIQTAQDVQKTPLRYKPYVRTYAQWILRYHVPNPEPAAE